MSNNIKNTVHIVRHTQHARKLPFNVAAAHGGAHLGLQGVYP